MAKREPLSAGEAPDEDLVKGGSTSTHLIFIPEVTKIFQFTSFKNWISPGIWLVRILTFV